MGAWFEDESFWSEMYPFMFPEERFRLAEEQIEQALALVGYKDGTVLDLCCGPGRHSLALAKRGIEVTAVDRSEFLLSKAKEEASKLNLEIEFVSDDMRQFVRSDSFSLVLNMFTSFGYFDDKEDDLKVLRNAYQSLKPEGAILIELLGKELLARRYQATISTVEEDSMNELSQVAPAFIEMAHRIVWCSAATVDVKGRPRSRILHPYWQWDGTRLVGWIGTSPTSLKRAHLNASPYMSLNYWAPSQDTCVAECRATWAFDDETRIMVWNLFLNEPEPLGYNPAIIPGWDSPTSDAFAAVRLAPWRLKVFPGSVLMGQGGETLTWRG